MDLGTYLEYDGRPAVRFERTYPHPIERLWAAITEPVDLAAWFPSTVRMDPREGGTISFADDPHLESTTGRILAYDPPRRLAYTWGSDELHFWLSSVDDGCTLIMINVLEADDAAARNAAGWTLCLGALDARLAGREHDEPHVGVDAPWRPVYEQHIAAGLPSGAAIPGETA